MHKSQFVWVVLLAIIANCNAQQAVLPSAPPPRFLALLAGEHSSPQAPLSTKPYESGGDQTLTRQQAEQMAIRNNPRIHVSQLEALAERQAVREQRAGLLPSLTGSANAVGAQEASRIGSGAITASRLLNHAGAGVEFRQLITDFGRTSNLVGSASLQANASAQDELASREAVVLSADLAFYDALKAQATLTVARSSQQERKNISNRISALAASKLKSTLDESFAQVNLSQADLLVLDTENSYNQAMATLNDVLGQTDDRRYTLVDDPSPPSPVAPMVEQMIAMALANRPDLIAQRFAHQADLRFAKAQQDQLLPTVSAMGLVGLVPVGSSTYFTQDTYGAIGVSVTVPIFDGFKYRAESSEALLRAQASDAQSDVLRNRIVRDVRTSWLASQTAQRRMQVAAQLVQEANMALDLANTRYQLGLSSIVELSQAQLQQTQAQIAVANARYDYEADLATLRFQSGERP